MLSHHKSLEDTFEVAEASIDAVYAANKAIKEDQADILDSQMVSMLGFVFCRLPSLDDKAEWFLICTSVSKIKIYSWSGTTATLSDLCDQREQSDDNLNIFSHVIKEEDKTFIFIMTPGAYLNLDPVILGKKPKDYNIPHKHWDKIEEERQRIITSSLSEVLVDVSVPSTETLIEALVTNTKKKIEYRRENSKTGKTDYDEADIDQATVLCIDLSLFKLSPRSMSVLNLPSMKVKKDISEKSDAEKQSDMTSHEDSPSPQKKKRHKK